MNTGEFCFVLFYIVLTFYTLSSLIIFAKDFFSRFSLIYHLSLFSNMTISLYLLLTLRKNPGKIEKTKSFEELEKGNTSRIEITIEKENATSSELDLHISDISETTVVKDELSVLYNELNSFCNICKVTIVKLYCIY
jgi:hypothetical protein